MRIILGVDGMVCEGCENRIKRSLMMIPQVTNVTASHNENKVVVTTSEFIDVENIRKKIEDLDFSVLSVTTD